MVNALELVIESWKTRRFVWGESDCSDFTADAIKAITGREGIAKGEFSHLAKKDFQKTVSTEEFHKLITDRLKALGFQSVVHLTEPAICIMNVGQGRIALGVFDGSSFWMTSPKGIIDVEAWDVLESWEFKE